jgi:mannitol-1-phosphate/altronate dehydrogenase
VDGLILTRKSWNQAAFTRNKNILKYYLPKLFLLNTTHL